MTKQQVKDEAKETEGRPEVRGRIRQLQQEAAGKRMLDDVPTASVVITNPTHYAIALKYDPDLASAPILVAKGTDLMAARIREIAQSSSVPIFPCPPLARLLNQTTEVGSEIPAELYVAVAQILSYLMQMENYMAGLVNEPTMPEINVPEMNT